MKFTNLDELEADATNEEQHQQKRKKKLSYDDRAIINSEIICYPITNISRPLDMFGPFPKTVKSFVPVAPPPPPNRKSSRTNSTLKLVTHHMNTSPTRSKSCSKHDSLNTKVSPIKKVDLNRSRSAGPALINSITASARKEDFRHRRISYRASSTSPVARRIIPDRKKSQSPIAFGRGISKERAFAVEKKKIDEELAKISKNLHVSTRILRNPELRSPNEVKKALQNTFKPITFSKDPKLASLMMKKSLERQAICQASKSEQKSLKVTVAISSRGREILRTSTETPQRGLRQTSNASTLSSLRSTTIKSIPSSRSKIKSKGSTLTGSNNSLNRTNSTFSINSEDTLKNKQKPQTITSKSLKKTPPKKDSKAGGKKLFQDSIVENNYKTVESINKAIVHQNEAIRSDAFFQKLFLRNETYQHGVSTSPTASVVEKTRMWNALTACKSEPSLRVQHYLRQSRPVSRSKFREIEAQNQHVENFRIFNNADNFDETELSRGGFVTEQIYKYDSLYQLSDEDEFGNSNRGRSLDFEYSFHHERSNSEPPTTNKIVTELVRSNSPVVIYGHNKSNDSEKRQRSSRSPSCRRIQNLKANKLMELSSYQKELVRAQSVGRTDRAKEKLSNLERSKSLNVLNYERHLPLCGHKRNERFRDLSEFYTCLERIGQLECATSQSDLRPRRRNEEIIDYDLWQKVREFEKNERELNILIRKLRAEQRDKGFLFQPHSPDEIRWTAESDLGLITKEKSVENLKEMFYNKLDENEMGEYQKLNGTRDNYKPLWRASSVLDLASNMTQKYNKPRTSSTLPRKEKSNLGLSKKLLSTLSKDQLNKIKNQLSEIYSGNETLSTDNVESFVVTVPPKKSPSDSEKSEKSFLTVRSHSELGKDQVQEPSIDVSTLKNVFEGKEKPQKPASIISESEKRSISQTLSQEAREKFAKKKIPQETSKTPQKPKRDISFTFKEARPAAEKYLVDCIPSRKQPQKVATETESISSETSNRTVIYRNANTKTAPPLPTVEDVQKKIKYFEEIERDKEKVATTIYHAAEDSSLDEEDDKKEIPSAPERIVPSTTNKLTSSQSFSDFNDIFGERSSMRSENFFRRSRSSSPESERYYKSLIELGDVEKLKMKFENCCSAEEDENSCHYIFSDSEINRSAKTKVRGHELGNVSQITHKYEMQSKQRARCRSKRTFSPILRNPIKRVDRLMPHINVISKTASLKDHQRISVSNRENLDKIEQLPSISGERVAEIKQKFESLDSTLSLMGKMYTSVPDIRELKDVQARLSHLPHCGSFASHQYPMPEDNGRSIDLPEKGPPALHPRKRPSSVSPVRSRDSKSLSKQLREIFSDESLRIRNRYLPDKQLQDEFLFKKKQHSKSSSSSVSWKGR